MTMNSNIIYYATKNSLLNTNGNTGYIEAPSLQQEGFIHCADRKGLELFLSFTSIAADHEFQHEDELLILTIDIKLLESPLKWEKVTGTTLLFPHIYGPINQRAVVAETLIHKDGLGNFNIPAEL